MRIGPRVLLDFDDTQVICTFLNSMHSRYYWVIKSYFSGCMYISEIIVEYVTDIVI